VTCGQWLGEFVGSGRKNQFKKVFLRSELVFLFSEPNYSKKGDFVLKQGPHFSG